MARKKSWKEIQFKDALWSVNKVKGNIEEGMKIGLKNIDIRSPLRLGRRRNSLTKELPDTG